MYLDVKTSKICFFKTFLKMNNISVLKINQFQKESNEAFFYVNTLEAHLPNSHIHIEKPHRHNFYATILFTKGSGIHEIDFNSHMLNQVAFFYFPPDKFTIGNCQKIQKVSYFFIHRIFTI